MRNSDADRRTVAALRGRPGQSFLVDVDRTHWEDAMLAVRRTLLCAADGEPCGQCAACGDAPHPDWVVTPDPERVKREHVADWPSRALIPPLLAPVRAFVVAGAERLTDEAANLLLKVLEEPPPHVVVVLVTDRPQDVLPTLISRCRLVRLGERGMRGDWEAAVVVLQGQALEGDWPSALEPLALALREAIREPGSVAPLRDWTEAALLVSWQAVVDAARDLEANANRDLVRYRLERALAGRG